MKKEELIEIGLTEEQANKVFALNGQDVEREKAKTTAAKADLADAREKLGAAQTELEGLRQSGGDAADLQKNGACRRAPFCGTPVLMLSGKDQVTEEPRPAPSSASPEYS